MTWSAPKGAALNRNFTVKVRLAGTDEWKEIPVYSDDMPDKPKWYKTADMARFFVGEHVEDVQLSRDKAYF